ncbi:MAG: peptide deformylase [Clostridia bacterium]|nr:peptide deformylase [Clostridia bacterium]
MAKRLIVQVPDPILAKKCREVENFDEKLWILLDDMKDTLFDAQGAGLAAPQVAVLKRVALVDTDDGFYELINPVIKSMKGEQTGLEGCLSVKGKYGNVTRANEIKVEARDRFGKKHIYKVSGFTARAFQHEIDHLDGIVYTSKCKDLMEEEE